MPRLIALLLTFSLLAPMAQARPAWPAEVKPIVSEADAARYRKLFAMAEDGQNPSQKLISALDDDLLVPHVQATAWLEGSTPPYATLRSWLAANPDLPQSARLYSIAVNKRPAAPQSCTTKSVKQKVATKKTKHKKNKKYITKLVKKKVCKAIGSRPELPPIPASMLAKQARQANLERLRELEYAGLTPAVAAERRRILGTVWKARQRKDFTAALAALDSPQARRIVGIDRWQTEVTQIADRYFSTSNWRSAYRVATIAGSVQGPQRDTALWIAGKSAYRLGNKAQALQAWQKLAQDEPTGGKHFSRATYWGARTAAELGQTDLAQQLLHQATKQPLTFYGQLALARLGSQPSLSEFAPTLRQPDVAALLKVPAAKRALALAQVGQGVLAQEELRSADPDLPYGSAKALAALGLQLDLPAVALLAGKQMAQDGHTIIPALYPQPTWQPTGGRWTIDRSLMVGIMRQESAFYPRIGSHVGAQGLMQIMPATGRYIASKMGVGNPNALHNPANNLAMAQRYLQYLNEKLDGNLMMVIAAYNGGAGNVSKWLRNGRTPGHDPLLWLESIPFDETRDYVEKVMANVWIYQQRAGKTPWSRTALADGYWPLNRMAAAQ